MVVGAFIGVSVGALVGGAMGAATKAAAVRGSVGASTGELVGAPTGAFKGEVDGGKPLPYRLLILQPAHTVFANDKCRRVCFSPPNLMHWQIDGQGKSPAPQLQGGSHIAFAISARVLASFANKGGFRALDECMAGSYAQIYASPQPAISKHDMRTREDAS